ncbi:MAG: hypothetical protein U0174_21010 [Polyangiaceae bacterium]
MRNFVVFLLSCFCLLAAVGSAHAAPPASSADVPAPLKPWVPWVLEGTPTAACAPVNGSGTKPDGTVNVLCDWPSSLSLQLGDKGGTFHQTWQVDAKEIVPLPGSRKHWPLDVRVDGKPAAVIERSDKSPAVELTVGVHRIEGAFRWDTLPEAITAPPRTGIVDLTVRGKHVAVPNVDASGEVFLSSERRAAEDDHLDVVVHRLIDDAVPLTVQLHITLQVSGKSREVLLGKSLGPGLIPLSLSSPLPARLEADSRLRLQLRPGTHVLNLVARAVGPVKTLERPKAEGPWRVGSEVWVFRAHPELRNVTVQGVSSVDPQQTRLPPEWKQLPAYLVDEGTKVELALQPRPEDPKAVENLTLNRELWLDFDGSGFSAKDSISGTVRRSTRLTALPSFDLGRVSISGSDQFITTMGDGRSGVELRQGPLSLSSDGRLSRHGAVVPAVGYDEDVHRLDATLHLPPGWRLFHASGVDEVPSTWLRHWTLLELFLVIILTLAAFRLWGPRAGALALVCFVLTFPEEGAPKWLWCFVLAVEGLARAFRHVRLKKWLTWTRHALVVVAAIVTLPFAVTQVRGGLYPALRPAETGGDVFGSQDLTRGGEPPPTDAPVASAMPSTMPVAPDLAQNGPGSASGLAGGAKVDDEESETAKVEKPKAAAPQRPSADKEANADTKEADLRRQAQANQRSSSSLGGRSGVKNLPNFAHQAMNGEGYDPTALVQTGKGRPDWTWTRIPLHYSGPVERTQDMRLYLASPSINLVLSLVRAGGLLLLLWLLRPKKADESAPPASPSMTEPAVATAVVLALGVLFAPARAFADEGPSAQLLSELRTRLVKPPSCLPSCASAARLTIDATPEQLALRFEVHAAAKVAVPILGSGTAFRPSEVLVDGKAATAMARESGGAIWVALEPGIHQVVLRGVLPQVNDVVIPLELMPHVTETHATGWTLSGLGDDGASDDNLHLARLEKPNGASGEATLTPSTLPPFLRVERILRIGLNWRVTTVVTRVSASDSAAAVEVPLLPGESITTADIRVSAGKAQVNLAPSVNTLTWESVLAEKSPLVMTASTDPAIGEVWRLDLSNIWNARPEGVQAVATPPGSTLPEWRPFPGERLTFTLERPKGVPGQVFTIDRSDLEISPGLRLTEAKLILQVRASRGMEHTIALPSGAVLDSVTIAGKSQVLRTEGERVVLPISPGSQTMVLNYHVPQGISFRYAAMWPDLKVPSVNARTTVRLSDARWVLFVTGPRLGPSVLFWSLLVVLLAVAAALGRVKWVRMKTYEWMLLALGLSQVHVVAGALVVGWLFLLGVRAKRPDGGGIILFNLRQIAIILATLVAAGVLVVAIHQGLLGHPDMQVRGNGSSSSELLFYEDRITGIAEAPVAYSAPMLAYRLVMLGWALWLASAVLRWLRWGFQCFGSGGMWRMAPRRPPPAPPGPPQQPYAYGHGTPQQAPQGPQSHHAQRASAESPPAAAPTTAGAVLSASLEPGQMNDVPLAPPRNE